MATAAKPQNVAVWFEIPSANFERAVGFYERIFATQLKREKFGPTDMAVFPYDGQGVSGAVVATSASKPAADGSIVYLNGAEDLAEPLSRVKAAGGSIAVGKTALPEGMGYYAQFIDSEGNRVGLHSMG